MGRSGNTSDLEIWLPYFVEGDALVGEDHFEEAEPLLETCLRFCSDPAIDASVRQDLAHCRRARGDLPGALELRREVKRLAPERHANRWQLAELLEELGQFDEAVMEADIAVRMEPSNRHYLETYNRIKRQIINIGDEASKCLMDFRVHTDRKNGFEIAVPEDWEKPSAGDLVYLLLRLFSRNAIELATRPGLEKFASMAIRVRKAGKAALTRQRWELSNETRVSVAGVTATQVEYRRVNGMIFRKIAVVHEGREYLIQFAHDGTFDTTIDRMIRSFRLI